MYINTKMKVNHKPATYSDNKKPTMHNIHSFQNSIKRFRTQQDFFAGQPNNINMLEFFSESFIIVPPYLTHFSTRNTPQKKNLISQIESEDSHAPRNK